jgi:hypothetical protein
MAKKQSSRKTSATLDYDRILASYLTRTNIVRVLQILLDKGDFHEVDDVINHNIIVDDTTATLGCARTRLAEEILKSLQADRVVVDQQGRDLDNISEFLKNHLPKAWSVCRTNSSGNTDQKIKFPPPPGQKKKSVRFFAISLPAPRDGAAKDGRWLASNFDLQVRFEKLAACRMMMPRYSRFMLNSKAKHRP